MTQPKDPRRNLPSASKVERYVACPGSYLLEKQVKPEEIPDSKDAQAGQRVHEARAEQDIDGLTLSETDLVEQMAQEEQRIFQQWADEYQVNDAEIVQEQREWLYVSEKRVFSAQLDFRAISRAKRIALILDRKAGRKGVTPSPRNWQLRSEAVLLASNYGVSAVRVAIVQPFAKRQLPCDYTANDIFNKGGALDQLMDILSRIHDPNSPLKLGPWCEHCPAKHICPKAKQAVIDIAAMRGIAWAVLTPEQKLGMWQTGKIAKKILEQIDFNVKADVTANRIPGLKLTDPTFPREFISTIKVYERLSEVFGQDAAAFQERFDQFSKVSVGAVEAYVAEQLKCSKPKAQQWVNEQMNDLITLTTKEGYVTLDKGEK